MRTTVIVIGVLLASSVQAEPLFAISDETLVARSVVGPSATRFGTLVNYHVLAADLDLAFTHDNTTHSALPSVGLKLKFLSTPENMGFTYVYAGARVVRYENTSMVAPCIGVRDFITYDIVQPWAFAFEWQAVVSAPEGRDELRLDGGASIGIARGEETARNFAVLVGWRRDRVDNAMSSTTSDGAFLTVSHQWR